VSPRLLVPGLVAGFLLLVGVAVASGAVGVSSPTPVPPTVVAVVATATIDTAGYALTQQNEIELCQCGK
jgi:hypothetical protein